MKTFSEFLTEGFKNLFNESEKEKYADEVWEILQRSYESIGGIKGSGFANKEDMINNIPLWKISTVDKKIVAVVLYKDTNGRKFVALGTDSSIDGKRKIIEMMKEDLKRSYGEVSKSALGVLMKMVDWSILKQFAIQPNVASGVLNKKLQPVSELKNIPEEAQLVLEKYPQLKNYGYIRELNGHESFKVMFGTINKKIVDKR
jgi:hypothetical protein